MQGDEPIAIMLSGGIDSSAVAALAKIGGHEVHTITVGFGGEVEYDERNIARRFAQEKGFDYNEVILNPEDYIQAFEELSQYIDEPITDSAVIAQWMLYKKMHQ
jgi:asparagine synthase (glutamine-hydrolysing)